jgi:hypothetical protein
MQIKKTKSEVRHKIVAKHGQCQGYKSISRDLEVPASNVPNVIKTFKAHATIANLPGRGHKRKLDGRLQQRICLNGGESTSINCHTDSI